MHLTAGKKIQNNVDFLALENNLLFGYMEIRVGDTVLTGSDMGKKLICANKFCHRSGEPHVSVGTDVFDDCSAPTEGR